MNREKVSFIVYKKNEKNYKELVYSLMCLDIPQNIVVDIVTIINAKSIAEAYNEGMHRSDARYKIYIKENAKVLQLNLIEKIINLFQENKQLGMIGVSGVEVIPTNGISKTAIKHLGKIMNNGKEILWKNIKNEYQVVPAIDGYFMATQYDIQWRSDLFISESFFDVAQCIEFNRKKFHVAIANQASPWVQCDDYFVPANENDKEKFLDTYSKDIFPLVSILIPTHNRPKYFLFALKSALNQTYRNIEIIISDDSDNNLTKEIVKKYLNISSKKIKYIKNDGFDSRQNWMWLLNNFNGEYFNFLLDDDIFDKRKIEIMMNYYLLFDNISIVSSYRQPIDKDGKFLNDFLATKKISKKTTIFLGSDIANNMVRNNLNFIGEPTTVLLNKKYRDIFYYFTNENSPIIDVKTWVALCKLGNVVYIPYTLSYFRIHNGQGQNEDVIRILGMVHWCKLFFEWYNKDFLKTNRIFYKEKFLSTLITAFRLWQNIHYKLSSRNEIKYIKKHVECEKGLFELINITNNYFTNNRQYIFINNFFGQYNFINRQKNRQKLLLIVAGYKENIQKQVFSRLEKYVTNDIDVCVVAPGCNPQYLRDICQKNEWSYLNTVDDKLALAQNLAIKEHINANIIYKIDEDIFITENYFSGLLNCYDYVKKLGKYRIGFIAPIIPVNGYGYRRFIEICDSVSEYEYKFGTAYSACMNIPACVDGDAAIWLWEKSVPLDIIAKNVEKGGKEYSICNHRFSIGAILLSRSFWVQMGGFLVGNDGDMGTEEMAICNYCMNESYSIIIAEKVLAGHFAFYPQYSKMCDFFNKNKEIFN